MRFRVLLTYDEEALRVHLKVLFLRFELFGDKKSKIRKSDFRIRKFRRRRDKILKKYKLKKEKKAQLKDNVGKKKQSPLLLIKAVKDIVADAVILFKRKLKIKRFLIEVDVGGRDAAKTAINYGYVIQALQYLVTFLESISNLDKTKNKKAKVNANFSDLKWGAKVDIEVSLTTLDILRVGISALKGYFKNKSKLKPKKTVNDKTKDGK